MTEADEPLEVAHRRVERGELQVLLVSVGGRYAPGSEGSSASGDVTDAILALLADPAEAQVLDLTRLDYVWGDAVGAGFVLPAKRYGIPVRLVATGRTKRALQDLVAVSGLGCLLGEGIQDSVADALRSLP